VPAEAEGGEEAEVEAGEEEVADPLRERLTAGPAADSWAMSSSGSEVRSPAPRVRHSSRATV